MKEKILMKMSIPLFVLFLVAACGTTQEEDPVDERLDEEAPINMEDYNDGEEPTEDETDDDFGEEIEEDAEEDIPENHLERDEETESTP